ncbi:hypothetical protein ANN_16247 [Periplaneta americana]|uniref:Uncharacterized protein n=1 Tax=Periplaneta americana TaxID=6978 RepID=A0ABQ8SIF6_PERAM|nr:hypothetical protein ANN_16247 [Periplaneta americana]
MQVVVITEDVQNVHLLLEYRPHIDVSLTCEHDPKLQEYCVCPQNMPQFDSERIPNQAPETNKPMILNGPTSRNREGSDQLSEICGNGVMNVKNVRSWVRQFKEGRVLCDNEPKEPRPCTSQSVTIGRVELSYTGAQNGEENPRTLPQRQDFQHQTKADDKHQRHGTPRGTPEMEMGRPRVETPRLQMGAYFHHVGSTHREAKPRKTWDQMGGLLQEPSWTPVVQNSQEPRRMEIATVCQYRVRVQVYTHKRRTKLI